MNILVVRKGQVLLSSAALGETEAEGQREDEQEKDRERQDDEEKESLSREAKVGLLWREQSIEASCEGGMGLGCCRCTCSRGRAGGRSGQMNVII